jgi:hypothetical protein
LQDESGSSLRPESKEILKNQPKNKTTTKKTQANKNKMLKEQRSQPERVPSSQNKK